MKTAKQVREILKENKITGCHVRSGTGSTVGQVIVTVTSKCSHESSEVKNALGYDMKCNLFIQ